MVFMQYGIKSVNMDDIAKHLNMSKKTLYLYVKHKEDLVRKSVMGHCVMEDQQVRAICQKGLNAIDEQLEIMHWVMDMLRNVHPSIMFDLEKYHPEVYGDMQQHREKAVYECMILNMKKGQSEGLYRKNFNAEAITKFYIARMLMIFDQKIFPSSQWNASELYMELFHYHIRGLASTKGLEVLKEKMKHLKY